MIIFSMYRSGCSCKKLLKDFDFVKEFGYFYWTKNKDKKSEAVYFRNENEELEIGYSFEKKEIYMNRYVPADSPTPEAFVLIRPGSYGDTVRENKKSHAYYN